MTDLTDASIQVRISRKTLATLAMWFYDQGDPPHSLSELARTSMEILKEFIVRKNFVPRVTSTLEATKALEKAGLGNLTVKGRKRSHGMKKYLQQMQIDEGVLEPFPEIEDPYAQARASEGKMRTEMEDDLSAAVLALRDKDGEVKKALKSVPKDSIVEEEKQDEKGKD